MVRNEEEKLPSCLQSAADLVDEIIVVDTGSTDSTKEIAARFGAKVFDFPWIDDFAAARNECIRHATGEWIFWMDADERVNESNREKLRTLFQSLPGVRDQKSEVRDQKSEEGNHGLHGTHGLESCSAASVLSVPSVVENSASGSGPLTTNHSPLTNLAYVMKCLCVQPGEARGGTVVDHVRLFRNRPEHRWCYRVHEQILPALKSTEAEIRWTDIVIHHVGYQDAATTRRKLERNLRLLQLDHAEHPDMPYILFNLGWAQVELGAGEPGCVSARSGPAVAIPLLQRSLQLSHPSDSIVKKLWALLATAHERLGQPDQALAACRTGRARYPADPELLFREGQLLAGTGNVDAAVGCFQRLVGKEEGINRRERRERGESAENMMPGGKNGAEDSPLSSVSSAFSAVHFSSFGSLEIGYTGYLARHELALLYHRKGMNAEAEAEWRAVVEEQPEHLPAWLGLGEMYLAQAKWEPLQDIIQRMTEENTSGHALHGKHGFQEEGQVLRARRMLAGKEYEPAKGILRDLATKNPAWVYPRIILSHVLLQEGKDEAAAEQVLREIVELDPSQAESWRNLAVLYRHQKKLAQSAAVCRSARVHCTRDPDLLLLQGIVLREMGDLIGAETCLLGVVSAASEPGALATGGAKARERRLQARHNLALVFSATGRLAEAEGQWHEVLAESPDYAPAHAGLEELQRRAQLAGSPVS
jgi:tetratricopeptide (TPR) repeat protein